MSIHVTPWSITGSDGEAIRGDALTPPGEPQAVIVIAHGLKGYKEYGLIARLAQRCADAGFLAHRFNFSHSGMTDAIDTFARPDLFERDTWNRQVFDLTAVLRAINDGRLPGAGLPVIPLGHSRGGVTVLLTLGRHADDGDFPYPGRAIAIATPAGCNPFSREETQRLLREGSLETVSARTGQTLRIGRELLQEQIDDPAGHDLPALVKRIACPLLLVHGEDDPTVPADCARTLAKSAGGKATALIIPGGDHVFNTPNPAPETGPDSPQFQQLANAVVDFASQAAAVSRT